MAQAAWCRCQAAREEAQLRVTTAFNRLLALPEAPVTNVSFSPEGVIVVVRLRRRAAVSRMLLHNPYSTLPDRRVALLGVYLSLHTKDCGTKPGAGSRRLSH